MAHHCLHQWCTWHLGATSSIGHCLFASFAWPYMAIYPLPTHSIAITVMSCICCLVCYPSLDEANYHCWLQIPAISLGSCLNEIILLTNSGLFLNHPSRPISTINCFTSLSLIVNFPFQKYTIHVNPTFLFIPWQYNSVSTALFQIWACLNQLVNCSYQDCHRLRIYRIIPHFTTFSGHHKPTFLG